MSGIGCAEAQPSLLDLLPYKGGVVGVAVEMLSTICSILVHPLACLYRIVVACLPGCGDAGFFRGHLGVLIQILTHIGRA